MSDRIGEELEAAVSSVTKFGFFVTLENTCEGLVPISELPGVPVFDEKHLTITACGKTYKTADRLTVRLVEADISTGKLRFEPV
jgi:ribonuclease R